ncbi:MAG: hypothetical protein IT210_09330 [Armatimonadetes bacterium]|nr:hypothetical protein [Armatimonadota bacterium]
MGSRRNFAWWTSARRAWKAPACWPKSWRRRTRPRSRSELPGIRRELLPGADVVVSPIGVGSRRTWEQDVFILR